MKLLIEPKLTGFIAATMVLGIAVAGSNEPDWWHSHGHGGGGVAAIGKPGHPNKVSRTVNVEMTDDMRFTPAQITVKRGETVRFIVNNSGKLKHEMVLGTEGELKERYHAMMKMPTTVHAGPNAVALDGGKFGEIIWQFTKFGTVPFGCLQPGHYEAGMKGSVTVK
ncbi:plastocyanin/azurin family copper-binding protein [Cupriavidus sp. UYPR2.512]|uniref:cupredoxin domain-containing protein n=1 Tax=Cupriavidus sp. UYPR2.512 TaxID=1080187 RepID=UPI00037010E5|nr:cupredoxin family protein [Cupriavidus sp. UYPR2.512]